MPQINWIFWIGLAVTIEQAIGQGSVKLTNVIPELWQPFIIGWCNLLAFIGTAIMTALSRGNQQTSSSAVKPIIVLAFIITGLLTLTGSVRAADMPVKVAAVVPSLPPWCSAQSCSGVYAGGSLIGNATNVNVIGNGINGSLNAGGQEMGLHAGYRAFDGTYYLGAEAGCSYNISSNLASDRLRCMELLKAGGALSALFGGQQSFQFPAVLQNNFMSFYGIVGASQRINHTGLVGGVGAEFFILKNLTMTLEYLNTSYPGSSPTINGVIAVKDDNLFRLGVNYNFPPR